MKLAYLAPALLFMTASAGLRAQVPAVAPLSFKALESNYQWDENLRTAEAALARALPTDASFWTSLDALEHAGAHCSGDVRDPGLARCVYSERITVDDYYPGNAIWTVVLHLEGDKAGHLTLSREVDKH